MVLLPSLHCWVMAMLFLKQCITRRCADAVLMPRAAPFAVLSCATRFLRVPPLHHTSRHAVTIPKHEHSTPCCVLALRLADLPRPGHHH